MSINDGFSLSDSFCADVYLATQGGISQESGQKPTSLTRFHEGSLRFLPDWILDMQGRLFDYRSACWMA
jgi:hypothetical protein